MNKIHIDDLDDINKKTLEIDQAASKYEKIFEEIQNYEISDIALDKIEEVLDENLKLRQDNIEMKIQLEDLQVSLEAQNFKNLSEAIKKRQSSNCLVLEELTPHNLQTRSNLPIPPPPPATPQSYKPKTRLLFWSKLDSVCETVFENYKKIPINKPLLEKFLFIQSKANTNPKIPANPKTVLNYKREIAVSSALRVICMSPDQIISKLASFSPDLCEDYDKLKALMRILPGEQEVESLELYVNKGYTLNTNESFIHKLSLIPNLRSIIDCIEFKLMYSSVIKELTGCLVNWKNTCEKVLNNKRLKNFLHLVLAFGNELNINHTKYGNAKGFKISTLNDLPGVRCTVDNNTSLLDILSEEYYNIHGNPHLFHHSEHLFVKEISKSSYKALLDTHEQFFKDYCRLSSMQFPPSCEKNIKSFASLKNKDIQNEVQLMEDVKKTLAQLHSYFGEVLDMDEEGRVIVFKILAKFYDDYIETVKKKWNSFSNRDSKRFTIINN